MTDRVYPSAKPNGGATANGTAPAANGTAHPPVFPAAKSQLYNPNRHPYRPQPNHRRRRSGRGCVCLCCFWSILVIILLLLLAAIAGCVVYVLYSPRRPSFTVTSVRISRFNLTTTAADETTHLTSRLNFTVSAKNPNKKLAFFYDPITITALSNDVVIGNGSFPALTSFPANITIVKSTLSTVGQLVDADSVKTLRSDLKKKTGLPLRILLDTKIVVKADKLKSKKIGIRVTCDEIHGVVPKGKTPSTATIREPKCKVDLRIKIWKWTF